MRPEIQEQRSAQLEIVVQPGDCRFSTDPNCRLITRRVESSMVLAVHVPRLELAALLRFTAPDSRVNPAQTNAWMFADTAIPLLFNRLRAIGIGSRDLSVYAIGGAVSTEEEAGPSGKSNILAMRRLLWREGVLLKGEDTGRNAPRTVWFEAKSGRIIVRTLPCGGFSAAHSSEGATLCHFAS